MTQSNLIGRNNDHRRSNNVSLVTYTAHASARGRHQYVCMYECLNVCMYGKAHSCLYTLGAALCVCADDGVPCTQMTVVGERR